MDIEVSVIVPTYNGADKIANLLKALNWQAFQDFELIVVVDGSTDNTFEMVQSFDVKFKKKIVVQPNQGRSVAKNNGAKVACGHIFIFYDDDMEPANDSVSRHVGFHAKNLGLLTGNQIEMRSKHKTDIQNYKALLSAKWTEKYHNGMNELDCSNLFFTAANCSFKRTDFLALKGFDQRLTDAEDYDIAYRALEAGVPVIFDKGNNAIHVEVITCRSYIARLRSYHLAHQKLKKYYPQRLGYGLASPPKLLIRFVYRFFAQVLFVRWIDQEKLKLLPRKLRYKFYDIVIHAFANIFPGIPI